MVERQPQCREEGLQRPGIDMEGGICRENKGVLPRRVLWARGEGRPLGAQRAEEAASCRGHYDFNPKVPGDRKWLPSPSCYLVASAAL